MRVAIDGRALTSPSPGVRRYTTSLTSALARTQPDIELVAVGGDAAAARAAGVAWLPAPWSLPTNLGWCLTGAPLGARRSGADVFHAPAYTAPLWGARPLVVTIHDVSYERRPEWYPSRVDPLRRAFYRRSAERADRVITDSAFSEDEIHDAYGIARDRIAVVPLGVDPAFRPDSGVAREPFVLHVGDLHARRHLRIVLDRLLALRRDPRHQSWRLVLIGADRGSLGALATRAREANDPAALEWIESVTEAELIRWYQRASLFAYPSRYEGFGLPVLEAMACGTPVVAARAGSVPEVAGDAAILLEPEDARAWRDALEHLMLNPGRRSELAATGLARAARFSWDDTARLTAGVYREASVGRVRPTVR